MKFGRFTLIIFAFASVMLIQSCSKDSHGNERIDLKKKSHYKSEIKLITKAEIPKGITPLVLENEEELDKLLGILEEGKI